MNVESTARQPSVFLETYGCQMNKYDSELVVGLLKDRGFCFTDNCNEADIILINTCSVREHAEKRALGRISVLARWKNGAPHRKLGVIGCMGQRLGDQLLRQKSSIDFVIGPDEYRRLPDILSIEQPEPCLETRLDHAELYDGISPIRKPGVSGWIAIMRGCNNFCTYCVVPFTRGKERSRSVSDILREIDEMVDQGYKEINLLGQNVNSYSDRGTDFPVLLEKVSRISGIIRIRFMTSHPKDLSDRLLEVMRDNEIICPHLHLPVQAGSNRILGLMNRKYTREEYMRLAEKARKIVPGIAVTTDVMVGFPDETESDFLETVELLKELRFEDAFTYCYSPRAGTRAATFENQVDREEKLSRLDRIIRLQRKIGLEKKKELLGRKLNVLTEGPSKQSPDEWMGRTPANHVVIFPKDTVSLGQPVEILIESLKGSTLRGSVTSNQIDSRNASGCSTTLEQTPRSRTKP